MSRPSPLPRRSRRVRLLLDVLTAVPLWLSAPLVRRWHLTWGATAAERTSAMPGDHVVPRAQFNATRAITVAARRDELWPWIVQLGYGRAGFYSYDLIDNAGRPSADRPLEEYQKIEVGDLIPMFHESHGLSIAYVVDSFETGSWMLWAHRPHPHEPPDSTWSWRLTDTADGGTRLVTRMKQDYRWKTPGLAMFNLALMELGDFAMERRMLRGIKARAVRASGTRIGAAPTGWTG